MFNFSFTDGESVAIHSLGNDAELDYEMSKVIQLLDLHRRGFGVAEVGGLVWSHATGLVGTDGQLTGSGGSFTLVLDAGAGSGLTSTATLLPDSDGDGLPDGCDPCPDRKPGDVSGDGLVDIGDIPSFTAVLLDPGAASADDFCAADTDEDGEVSGLDIRLFVPLILAP